MTKTEHYQLNQWEKTDRVLREDFNEDNRKIEAALTALSSDRIVIGSYIGDGTSETRIINLPFTPKIVMVSGYYGNEHVQYGYYTIAFGPYCHSFLGESNSSSGNIQLTDNGFQILGIHHNLAGKEEHYLALC